MCCDAGNSWDPQYNRSCCPGLNAINLFTIGSELGTASSITLSSSSRTETSSSSSSSRIPSPNSITIYIDGSSVSAPLSTTALSSTVSTSSSFGLSPSYNSSFTSKTNSATRLASGHSRTHGSIIAIVLGTLGSAVVLVITSIWIYRRRGKNKRKPQRKQVEESSDPEIMCSTQEMSGQQAHELPTSVRYLTQELPQSKNHIRT